MRVYWTDTALEHLQAIHSYIAQDSVAYARQVVDRLTRRSEQIALFPLSGRMAPLYDNSSIREVVEGPYRIIYRVKASQVDMLAVLHRRQLLPSDI